MDSPPVIDEAPTVVVLAATTMSETSPASVANMCRLHIVMSVAVRADTVRRNRTPIITIVSLLLHTVLTAASGCNYT